MFRCLVMLILVDVWGGTNIRWTSVSVRIQRFYVIGIGRETCFSAISVADWFVRCWLTAETVTSPLRPEARVQLQHILMNCWAGVVFFYNGLTLKLYPYWLNQLPENGCRIPAASAHGEPGEAARPAIRWSGQPAFALWDADLCESLFLDANDYFCLAVPVLLAWNGS